VSRQELQDALAFAAGSSRVAPTPAVRSVAGAVAPVEDRLVYTVEEAATLLGISRSFAYEAVQKGDIPSMRIGRRILVPKGAMERFLATGSGTQPPSSEESAR
jgi:excisionase family DNA binding protein